MRSYRMHKNNYDIMQRCKHVIDKSDNFTTNSI